MQNLQSLMNLILKKEFGSDSIIICATDGDIEEKFEHVKIPNKVQVVWLINQ